MFLFNSSLPLRKIAAAILLAMFGTLLVPPMASADDDEALLIISNKTKKTIAVYWQNGPRERLYGKFRPGQVSEQPTFRGHRWVIRDAESGAVLRTVQAAGGTQEVELRDRTVPLEDSVVTFGNSTDAILNVFVISEGREMIVAGLEPGQQRKITTAAGSKFVFRNRAGGEVVGRFTVSKVPDTFTVEGNKAATPPTPGGFGTVDVTDENVVLAARVAARRNGATLVKVLKAQAQVVAGTNYSLTLTVRINGELREARADVFVSLEDEFKVTRWELSGDKQKPVVVDEARAALQLINEQRKKEGKAPLVENAKLMAAARAHTENMVATQVFAHTIGNSTLDRRLDAQGYVRGKFGAGENCARMSEPTGEAAFLAWMGSTQGHREGMLDGKWTEAGIASITRDGTTWWTFVASNPRE